MRRFCVFFGMLFCFCLSALKSNADASLGNGVSLVKADIQKIVRSPIEFKYERPDQENLVAFRKQAKLDEIIGGGTDFEQLVRLMDWVGSAKRDNDSKSERGPNGYLWGVKHLIRFNEEGKPVISGHCMSYAAVMVDACTALGFKARHYAVEGFRQMSHEVVEVWVPSLGRWIYFDPSLTQYYMDLKTGSPLSLLEMHRIVVDTFIPEGKDMAWFVQRQNPETREVVKKIGGKSPIAVRQGPSHYGKPADPDYDWGWQHGYLAAGYLQMTPRNDFNSNPSANPGKFEQLPGYANYPFWIDDKTPAKEGVTNVYSKESDFYWTLDQASFEISADLNKNPEDKAASLVLKLENSMPFFSHYLVYIDGLGMEFKESSFKWQLRPGENKIEIVPVDEFGKKGKGSSAVVRYDP